MDIGFDNIISSKTGKLIIPDNITNIKLDIGLSCNSPYSQLWLSKLPDRIVFGFEPNPKLVNYIKNRSCPNHSNLLRLDPKYIGNKFFLIECAIDDECGVKKFYMNDDHGTSSLYEPVEHKIEAITEVKCIRLSHFFELIPWDKFEYIEHIKLDTQANDLRVLMSGDDYIRNKVVYITIECANERAQYICNKENSGHTREQVSEYMNRNGFVLCPTKLYSPKDLTLLSNSYYHSYNLTFLNMKFKDIANKLDSSLLVE